MTRVTHVCTIQLIEGFHIFYLICHCDTLNKQTFKPSNYKVYRRLSHVSYFTIIPLEEGLTDVRIFILQMRKLD